jgi:hypothetical protein
MPCEHYKDALIEAAANGFQPQGALRVHLDACAACRAAFEQEQSLFASIDAGLHVTANADVPTSLLPRVRARLAEEAAPKFRWLYAWSALAASVVLVVALLLIRSGRHNAEPQFTASRQLPDSSSPSEIVPASGENPARPSVTRTIAKSHHRAISQRPATNAEQPQVLVPVGQEKVIALLIQDLRNGEGVGEALLAYAREQKLQDLEISPLEVSPLEVKPLSEALQEPR